MKLYYLEIQREIESDKETDLQRKHKHGYNDFRNCLQI